MIQRVQVNYDICYNIDEDENITQLAIADTDFEKSFLNNFVGRKFSAQLIKEIRSKIKEDQLLKYKNGKISIGLTDVQQNEKLKLLYALKCLKITVNYKIQKGIIEFILPKLALIANILGSILGIIFDAIATMIREDNKTGVGVGITGAAAGGIMLMLTFRLANASERLGIIGRKADDFIRSIFQAIRNNQRKEEETPINTTASIDSNSTSTMLRRLSLGGLKTITSLTFGGIAGFDGYSTANGVYEFVDLVVNDFISEHSDLSAIEPEYVHYISITMFAISFVATTTFDISILVALYQEIENYLKIKFYNKNEPIINSDLYSSPLNQSMQ